MIIKEVQEHEFVRDMTQDGYGFTYDGAHALYAYLSELSEDIRDALPYDPVAFRCEFSEYESAFNAAQALGWPDYEWEDEEYDEEELEEAALDWLYDRGTVVQFNDGVIVSG